MAIEDSKFLEIEGREIPPELKGRMTPSHQ
jgi:hypothetical protein